MKKLFSFFVLLSLMSALAIAQDYDDGTLSSNEFGNYSFGVESSADLISTSNVNFTPNAQTSVGSNQTNATLVIVTNNNSYAYVTIVQYDSKPSSAGSDPANALGRWVDIATNLAGLNYSVITVRYSDAEVSSANLMEGTMRLYRWNGTTWTLFDGTAGGIDTENNFVYANTTQFSIWGVFGQPNPAPATSTASAGSSGGGGGGSGFDWQCTAWSQCSPQGTQTRTCTQIVGSGSPAKPAESQSCTYRASSLATSQQGTRGQSESQGVIQSPKTTQSPQSVQQSSQSNPTTGLAAITGNVVAGIKANSIVAFSFVIVIAALVGLYFGYSQYKKRHKKF